MKNKNTMNAIEKIKTEIERLKSVLKDPLCTQGNILGPRWVAGANKMLKEISSFIASLQQELPAMIQWTGDNLKEVIDFTGKSPRIEEWFKSWEEFETYVHQHNDILKLFCEDGSHYEVPVGAWIVKTPDGYNLPSIAKYIQQEQLEVDLDKLVNEEFASHSRTTEYGLEATYNRAELYQLIKRMALVFNARKL